MSFDASFDCERFFLMYLLPKNRFHQPLSTLPKTFYPVAQKISELGCVMLTGLPGEAVDSILGYARS